MKREGVLRYDIAGDGGVGPDRRGGCQQDQGTLGGVFTLKYD